MELLILKSGPDYIRCREKGYLRVCLDKASVFPTGQMEVVQQHESRLKEKGFDGVCIKKLILTEKDL